MRLVLLLALLAGCTAAHGVPPADAPVLVDARRADAPLSLPDARVVIDARVADARSPDARPPDAPPPDARTCPQGCCAASDCLLWESCDTTTHTCGTTCSVDRPCNDGCCGSDGKCHSGQADKVCGSKSAMCRDCAVAPEGPKCRNTGTGGTCGCNVIADCPLHMTCDYTTFTCSTTCVVDPLYATCNGGCCDPKTHLCNAGTDAATCGWDGSVCSACATGSHGPTCMPYARGGECGCSDATQCLPPDACKVPADGHVTLCCGLKGASCASADDCCSHGCFSPGGCQ